MRMIRIDPHGQALIGQINSSVPYLIVEAEDREAALALYRSRRCDCVVLELALPDQSGFQLLGDLVPSACRPRVAVVVLTHMTQTGVRALARLNGAYGCLVKQYTTGEDLDRATCDSICRSDAQGGPVRGPLAESNH